MTVATGPAAEAFTVVEDASVTRIAAVPAARFTYGDAVSGATLEAAGVVIGSVGAVTR
jgi:hypothetical protein